LVALFAIMGDGLAPFRAVDTYHMLYIATFHQKEWRLRNEKQLPALGDKNDLPITCPGSPEVSREQEASRDVETSAASSSNSEKSEVPVGLSPAEQRKLVHHQTKFAKSHSFYKPHETSTHHAFPLRLLIAVVVLLDFHSIFQIALGTCTWAINYHHRSQALTTVILCCSLTCNITGGILISIGDKRTRKKDVKERMFRQQLTDQAIAKLERRREREAERNGELSTNVLPGT